MYGIGTVARLAQISVRTLRHYDEVGLLRPTKVDARTGQRFYSPEQLRQLHRILALRDLGVPLAEIGGVIAEGVTVEQLRGILRLRQAEAHAHLKAQQQQLARVAARLAQLEEAPMEKYEVLIKRLDPVRVMALTEDLADRAQIPDTAGRLYPRLHQVLQRNQIGWEGVSYAFYEELADSDRPLRMTVGLPIPEDATVAESEIDTMDIQAVERAATTVVKGEPTQFHDAFTAIHTWVDQTGERATRFEREVYLDCDGPRDTWVTELQVILD